MSRNTEKTINIAIAEALRRRHPRWNESNVDAERTDVLQESSGRQPDILVREPKSLPVVIESEVMPAGTVEGDARGRLGNHLQRTGEELEAAVALRIPTRFRRSDLRINEEVEKAEDFEACLWTAPSEGNETPVRWPEAGWLQTGMDGLAGIVEKASLGENRIKEGEKKLRCAVNQTAEILCTDFPDTAEAMAAILQQKNDPQTIRMAMAIIANALTFHISIAGTHRIQLSGALAEETHTINPLRELKENSSLSQNKLIDEWKKILQINYIPIFEIASKAIASITDEKLAQRVLERLAKAAHQLDRLGATSRHDLSGQMLQALLRDRKFLATFYTLLPSATLAAGIAVDRLETDWSNEKAVKSLQIADFACGTGALLGAAYRACLARRRRAGGDDQVLHRPMMEESLIGTDIVPVATHLTTSMLASMFPGEPFAKTQIVTMRYGEDKSWAKVHIGALDLLTDQRAHSSLPTGQTAILGAERESRKSSKTSQMAKAADDSFDLILMNPPFTRPHNHEGTTALIPSFAGLGKTDEEMKKMAKALKSLARTGQAGHGNAGLGSNFLDLACTKCRPGGTIVMILPAACLQGASWSKARALLKREFEDLMAITIAASGQKNRAFSSDTGMAETILVGTKRSKPLAEGQPPPLENCVFVNLRSRPGNPLEAEVLAQRISAIPPAESHGSIEVAKGESEGTWVRGDLGGSGLMGIQNPETGAKVLSLANGSLTSPSLKEGIPVPLAPLEKLGTRGLYDLQIRFRDALTGEIKAPFDIESIPQGDIPDHPALWAHNAKREKRMLTTPDSKATVIPEWKSKAAEVWKTASRLHFNRDFQINSQPLAACITEERTLGGRAWPNFTPHDPEWEIPLALWANTTLGLVLFWWTGTRQQQGRSNLTISRLPEMPSLDMRKLKKRQIKKLQGLWPCFQEKELLPANEAYRDPVRKELDQAVLGDALGLPAEALKAVGLLRQQWCAEPSVHGGKSTAPRR